MARPPFPTWRPFPVSLRADKMAPPRHRESDKGAPEKVETLIYMRFRGRPHSHKTFHRTGNWFRCSYFVAALGGPRARSTFFLGPCQYASDANRPRFLDYFATFDEKIRERWPTIERYAPSHPDRGRNTRKADVGTLCVPCLRFTSSAPFCSRSSRSIFVYFSPPLGSLTVK